MYEGSCRLKYDLLEKLLGTAINLHARYDIFKIATTFQVLHRILGLREIIVSNVSMNLGRTKCMKVCQ